MRSVKQRMPRVGVLVAALVGLAVALTGCGSVYDLPLPGGADVGSNPLTVHIMFRDVADLVPQSTVKVNDVSVGKVTAISLKGQVADVTVQIPRATKLPANALATIRQTSLLGEKFVSLSAPSNPEGTLSNGSTIGLANSGANPEVEQVLKAMGALLSGGGVGQLKLISEELNQAIGGKESQVRSVLTQLHYFMGQLAGSKAQIVTAIDNLNRLAVSLKKQDPTIVATLNDLPAALASVNGQRSDLKKMLAALNKLSGVGVQVIQASKTATINSLTNLAPVLSELARAGDNIPKAFQIFLTYPFVDATVGQTVAAARNFETGDYTNLSVNLDLDLQTLCTATSLTQLCSTLGTLCTTTKIPLLCSGTNTGLGTKTGTTGGTKSGGGTTSGGTSGSGSGLGGVLGGLGHLLGRTAYGSSSGRGSPASGDGMSYLLYQGAIQ